MKSHCCHSRLSEPAVSPLVELLSAEVTEVYASHDLCLTKFGVIAAVIGHAAKTTKQATGRIELN